jgi:prepilin-type N-terminal cleavage/methylation domain-containing protein
MTTNQNKGFTLLEILLVIAAIGILAAIVLVAINPNRQIEAARQAKRRTDINTITKAIQQYSIDNNGQYPTGIETGAKAICQTGNTPTGCIDLSTFLVPTYIASIPEADSNRYYVRKNISGTSIEITHPRDEIWNIGGTPSLDLNFASNKSLIDSVSGNNLITFTRNSPATYVGEDGLIKTAAANEPRFDHDPMTGESLGLLVEEQRTNFFPYSEAFNQNAPYWIKTSTQVDLSPDILSPDGLNKAYKLSQTNISGNRYMYEGGLNLPSGTYTASIFVKAAEKTRIRLRTDSDISRIVEFNLLDGTIVSETNGGSGKIVTIGNGWYRISNTFNASSNVLNIVYTIDSQAGNVGDGLYIWGAQLEQGSFPTSYIPTSGNVLERIQDEISIEGDSFTSFYNINEGSIFMQYRLNGLIQFIPGTTGNSTFYIFMDEASIGPTSFNKIQQFASISSIQNRHQVNSTNYNPTAFSPPSLNVSNVIGMAYKVGTSQIAAYSNTNISFVTAPSPPNNISILRIGNSNTNIDTMNGTISYFKYYSSRLSNTQIQNISK